MQGVSFWVVAVVAVLSTGLSSQAIVQLDCQPGWQLMGVHCYKMYTSVKPWESAAQVCKDYGSELAKVTDFYENQDIGEFATSQSVNNFWIGYSRYNYSGFTRMEAPAGDQIIGFWSDGEETVTAVGFWENDQPNDDEGKCVYIMQKASRYYWSFGPCESKMPYICQRPACPAGSYHCVNGRCTNQTVSCDGEDDCGDSSDEMDCASFCTYHLQQASGTIQSRNYPNNYQDAVDCRWVIQVPLGQNAYIRFTNFSTESNIDIVQVFVGGMTEDRAELVGMFSGVIMGNLPEYTSTNNFIIVKFTSDIGINNIGFRAEFGSRSDNMPVAVPLIATDTEGLLRSPNYPSPYLAWQDYTWIITTERQTQIITLKVEDLDLEGNDEILVRDGKSVEDNLIYRFTADTDVSDIPYLFSTGNSLYVYLNTRGYKVGKGFFFTYKQGCEAMFSTTAGHIFSPGYPLSPSYEGTNYPNLVSCTFRVDVPSRPALTLRYETFKTQSVNDVITVQYGAASTDMLSGSTSSVRSRTVNGQFNVTFMTDAIIRNEGFSFMYSVDCPNPNFNDKTIYPNPLSLQYGSDFTVRCMNGYQFASEEYQDRSALGQKFVSLDVVRMECLANGKWNHDTTPVCMPQYCGPAPLVDNAYVNSSTGQATSFGGVVNYACYPGFTINGNNNVACQSDGTWERTPNCSIAACPPATNIIPNGNGSVSVGDGTEFGSIVNYTCNPGYQISGEPIIFCTSGSTWTADVPICIRKNCPVPFIQNGFLNDESLAYFGDLRTLTCNAGYQRVGRATFACGTNHMFDNFDEMKCEDIDECNRAGSCDHNCQNTEGSYTCSCRDGFMLNANNRTCNDILECSTNNGGCNQNCIEAAGSYSCRCNSGYELFVQIGQLNYTIPPTETGNGENDIYRFQHTCVRIQCADPPALANGYVLTNRRYHRYQDYIIMSCDIGYVLTGSSLRQCQANGQWSGTNPVCTPATCPADSLPGGLQTIPSVSPVGSVGFKQYVNITCNVPGKTQFTKQRQCLLDPESKDYKLFGAQYECGVIDCGQPTGVPGANLQTLPRTTYGSTFTFSCNNLYTKDGTSDLGNDQVTCKDNGYWGWGSLRCLGITCTDPGRPVDGTQHATTYEEGKSVNFTCNRPGYTIVGNPSIKCLINQAGNALAWDGPVPQCADTQKPTFTNCVTSVPVSRYSPAINVVPIPTPSDNTGISSFSVHPAWPTASFIIAVDWLFNFTAVDFNGNSESCYINVKVRDETPPRITCPGPRTIPYAEPSDVSPITFDVAQYSVIATDDSGIPPTVTFIPPSIDPTGIIATQPTYNRWIIVTAKDMANNTNQCKFQVVYKPQPCSPFSLPTPVHGQKNCVAKSGSTGYTCNLTCDAGYAFRDQPTDVVTTECNSFANFNLASPIPACSQLSQTPSYLQKYRIDYNAANTGTLTESCAQDFASAVQDVVDNVQPALTQLCQAIALSPTANFLPLDPVNDIGINIATRVVSITFTIVITSSNPQSSSLDSCGNFIQTGLLDGNYDETKKLTGQLTPIRPQSCPDIQANVGAAAILVSEGFQCDDGQELISNGGNRYCLNCPKGTFLNSANNVCEACPLGTYSNVEGAASCRSCITNYWTETVGATDNSSCKATCIAGTRSSTRLPPCTECTLNTYWVNSTTCENCQPNYITRDLGSLYPTDCKAPCTTGNYNSIDGHENCTPCPVNFYQDQTGQITCKSCASTDVTPNVGSQSSLNCTDGSVNCGGFCLNGGVCTTVSHSSACSCEDGFYGERCQNAWDPCTSDPCYNNGVCIRNDTSFSCDCPSGTTGDRCEVEENNCNGTPCLNGGMCQDQVNRFICLCKQGYTGSICENLQPICQAEPCANGACNPIGTFRRECDCYPGFSGKDCEIDLNECDENPCLHGGTCEDRVDGFNCKCPPGFTGGRCDIRLSKCTGISCGNMGQCVEDHIENTYRCVCNPEASFGEYCEYIPRLYYQLETVTASLNVTVAALKNCKDLCTSDPLCNGFSYNSQSGICLLHNTRSGILPLIPQTYSYYYIKDCDYVRDDFYTQWYNTSDPSIAGNYITISYLRDTLLLDICDGTEPLMVECRDLQTKQRTTNGLTGCSATNGFTCDNSNQGSDGCNQHEVRFKCAASRVFTENVCNITTYCQSSPCMYGTCIENGLSFTCDCPPGYGGSLCQNNLDDCASNPCDNGATCVDLINSFDCKCATGFEGPTCAMPINFCSTSPCNATGSYNCTNTRTGAQCHCRPGYTNPSCSLNIQECDSNPCYNNGDCVDGIGTYTCNCKPGWTGSRCEYLVKQCDPSSPCLNGAACYNIFGNYFCKCKANTYGQNCQEAPSVCSNANPCVHGSCSEESGVTSCSCPQDYMGQGCEIQVQHCSSNSKTCQNGGTCSVTALNNYECSCPDGFGGLNCDINTNDCSPNNCPINSYCVDGVNEYFCRCPVGRTGENCTRGLDRNYDMLFESPQKVGYAYIPFPILVSTNKLSVSLWVRYWNKDGTGTFFSMFTVEGRNSLSRKKELMRIDESGLTIAVNGSVTKFAPPSTIDYNDGRWYQITVTWNGETGDLRFVVNTISNTIMNYATGMTIDSYVWVMIGAKYDVMNERPVMYEGFNGWISQLVLHSRDLVFEREIPLKLENPQIIFNDEILAWNEFRRTGGVSIKIPSTASSTSCPRGYSGPGCLTPNQRKQVVFPKQCPGDQVQLGASRITRMNWTEPQFEGSVIQVESTYKPGDVFVWDRYLVVYVATNAAGNKGLCSFKLFVQYTDCPTPANPYKGLTLERRASSPLITSAIQCDVGYETVRPVPALYTCPRIGSYNPLNKYNTFKLPPCGLVVNNPLRQILLQLIYRVSSVFCSGIENSMKTKFQNAISSLNARWGNGLCQNPGCTDILISVGCTGNGRRKRQTINEVLATVTLPQANADVTDGTQTLSPDDVLRLAALNLGSFDFSQTIPQATPVSDLVTVTSSLSCQVGHAVVDGQCVKCAPGTFYNSISLSCDDCPVGWYQPNEGATTCLSCGAKTTELQGASSPADCQDTCQIGQFYNESINACSNCPIGFYQNLTSQFFCWPCSVEKTTRAEGSASLNDCYIGCSKGEQLGSSGTCELCPIGKYRDASMPVCDDCPSDLTTQVAGADDVSKCNVGDCQAGYIRNTTDQKICEPCPIGTYQDIKNQYSCKDCGTSPYDVTFRVASTSFLDCKFVCADGQERTSISASSCTPCKVGYFRNMTRTPETQCWPCYPGTSTPSIGTVNPEDCTVLQCPVSQQPNVNNTQCEDCPLGTYQDQAKQPNCKACQGQTSTRATGANSSSLCEFHCPGGQEKLPDGSCRLCEVGYYKDNNMDKFMNCTKCSDVNTVTENAGSDSEAKCTVRSCQAGYKRSADESTCEPCPIGFYQSLPYQSTCDQCSGQTSTRQNASTSSSQCEGFCPSGQEKDNSGLCRPCSRGYFKDNSNGLFENCEMCPIAFITSGTGAQSSAQCTVANCSAGYKTENNACVECPIGFYQEQQWQPTCQQCPTDKTTTALGATSSADCILSCPPGKEDIGGTCTPCKQGYYKVEEKADLCTECPTNTTTNNEESKSQSDCNVVGCPPGYYNISTTDCEPCDYGFYQPDRWQASCLRCDSSTTTFNKGASSPSDCVLDCEAGKQLNLATRTCEDCPRGYYQDKQNPRFYMCIICGDPERITPGTGATSASMCTIQNCTTPGQFRNATTNVCQDCAIGTYQDTKWEESCKPCLSGYTTQTVRSPSSSSCVRTCELGKYQLGDSCVDCGIGKYRDGTTWECQDCPNGLSTTSLTAASVLECNISPCNAGYYFDRSSGDCKVCPINTYQEDRSTFDCSSCPSGKFTTTVGNTRQSDCKGYCDSANVCPPNSNCEEDPDTRFKCTCKSSYVDTNGNCTHICDSNYCLYGSTCLRSESSYCACAEFYKGPQCSIRRNAEDVSSQNQLTIVGIVVGILGFLLLLILLAVCLFRRRHVPEKRTPSDYDDRTSLARGPYDYPLAYVPSKPASVVSAPRYMLPQQLEKSYDNQLYIAGDEDPAVYKA